jgi:hypothetical protein
MTLVALIGGWRMIGRFVRSIVATAHCTSNLGC